MPKTKDGVERRLPDALTWTTADGVAITPGMTVYDEGLRPIVVAELPRGKTPLDTNWLDGTHEDGSVLPFYRFGVYSTKIAAARAVVKYAKVELDIRQRSLAAAQESLAEAEAQLAALASQE